MICERCEGKGIVLSDADAQWHPNPWDGSERRKEPREGETIAGFNETPAPFYTTCENCQGLGRILPGLISPRR